MTDAKQHDQNRSGEHRLELGEALRDPRNAAILEEARGELEKASNPPTSGPASAESLEELADELDDASSTLTESVDQIVGVLLLVLGKITAVTKAQAMAAERTRSALVWIRAVTIVSVFAFFSLAVLLYRVDQSARSLHDAEDKLTEALVALKQTNEKVDVVKQKAEETPRVEIVADSDQSGGAVVRITPPAKRSDDAVSDARDPNPNPSSAVEIPIDLNGAKSVRELPGSVPAADRVSR